MPRLAQCEKKAPSKGAACEKFKPKEGEVDAFRASLAKLADVYVNDAFGTAHRAHSSMVGLAGKMPCACGLLVKKELEAFSNVLDPAKVQRPLTAIVGGAKISDKILVIENLIDQSDRIMCIGGMAYTFLKARLRRALPRRRRDMIARCTRALGDDTRSRVSSC